MKIYKNRLDSFAQWPVARVSAQDMATNGFYYSGASDDVRCAFCKVELCNWWNIGGGGGDFDDPSTLHRLVSPKCPLYNNKNNNGGGGGDDNNGGASQQPPASTALSSVDECRSKREVEKWRPKHSKLTTKAARLATFDNWPKSVPVAPDDLADAGFFYTNIGDHTECFYCGGSIRDWESGDSPWWEHARWFDRCRFVRLIRGDDYVQMVVSESAVIRAPPPPPPPPSPSTTPSPPPPSSPSSPPPHSLSFTESEPICKICYTNKRNACFVPCNHVVACVECSACLTECPVCRRPVDDITKLYFA
uniref:Inhibitor of apoptosis protein 3 n=1 Tax=Dendrolimus kikuchii nucleopolyhedrovirus TaxID=1219875 RepID=V9LSP8_9ABAC|nr:inhibitor of apoptosis protein 3 [Dendrolimus kikuchii nucleopolyhedrovirus]